MSLLLLMVARNIPLHTWRECEKETAGETSHYSGWTGTKNLDHIARLITNSCSSNEVVKLIAREWEYLPPLVRMSITHEMNQALGTRSNNKTKGIRRLDELLAGKVLRSQQNEELTDRKLITVGGKLIAIDKKLNPAVLGASRTYATYALPANYNNLPPAEKRRLREELAKQRREDRQ